jgi:hypothetical protein
MDEGLVVYAAARQRPHDARGRRVHKKGAGSQYRRPSRASMASLIKRLTASKYVIPAAWDTIANPNELTFDFSGLGVYASLQLWEKLAEVFAATFKGSPASHLPLMDSGHRVTVSLSSADAISAAAAARRMGVRIVWAEF